MENDEITTAPANADGYACEGCIFDGEACKASHRQIIDCTELNIIYIKKNEDEKD